MHTRWEPSCQGIPSPPRTPLAPDYTDFEAEFTPAVEIGWRLGSQFWGQGYATEGAHLCLQQGTDLVGYAHVQFWPPYAKASEGKPLTRAALRIIVVEETHRNQGLGGLFLGWIERWLKVNGTQRLQTESSPAALRFYPQTWLYRYAPRGPLTAMQGSPRMWHWGRCCEKAEAPRL